MIYLLHGSVGHSSDWDFIINSLKPFECCALDLYEYSSESIATAAEEINTLAHPGDIIIGYSLGARIALQATVAADSLWSKAVIISGHTGIIDAEERTSRVMHDKKWSDLCMKNWNQFITEWENQPVFHESDPIGNRDPLRPARNKVAETFINWSTGKQLPVIKELSKIDIPTLWLAGEKDIKYKKIAEHASSVLSKAEAKIITKSGHRVPWDNPKDTADAINVFIS